MNVSERRGKQYIDPLHNVGRKQAWLHTHTKPIDNCNQTLGRKYILTRTEEHQP